MSTVQLRAVTQSDLPIFYEQQLDPSANQMAAFAAKDPTDEAGFMARWQRILADETIFKQSILVDGRVAGHLLHFDQFGQPAVSYWLGRKFWGRGVATAALRHFLRLVTTRPLYARAAKDNLASLRVLAKCGFTIVGEDTGFAEARGEETAEFILQLAAEEPARSDE
jgi:RimJ/RimL family protein N-acetyltransferase